MSPSNYFWKLDPTRQQWQWGSPAAVGPCAEMALAWMRVLAVGGCAQRSHFGSILNLDVTASDDGVNVWREE